MEIIILRKKLSRQEVLKMASESYGDMIKGVADVEKKIIALGGALHADAEAVLLRAGSEQKNLWGFNFYPEAPQDENILFTSLINIRPAHGNKTIEVQSTELKKNIREIIERWIEK